MITSLPYYGYELIIDTVAHIFGYMNHIFYSAFTRTNFQFFGNNMLFVKRKNFVPLYQMKFLLQEMQKNSCLNFVSLKSEHFFRPTITTYPCLPKQIWQPLENTLNKKIHTTNFNRKWLIKAGTGIFTFNFISFFLILFIIIFLVLFLFCLISNWPLSSRTPKKRNVDSFKKNFSLFELLKKIQ